MRTGGVIAVGNGQGEVVLGEVVRQKGKGANLPVITVCACGEYASGGVDLVVGPSPCAIHQQFKVNNAIIANWSDDGWCV